MPVSMTQGGQVYYLAYDQVGSLRIVTDAAGTVVKQVDYDSFGNILSDSNPTFTVPFGFAGGLHDRDTGLVRFGARDYDPATGKWTAKDPIDFGGGDLNLLSYTGQDPVNWVDPEGNIKDFLILQFIRRVTRPVANFFLNNVEPAGRRIIASGLTWGVAGAVGGGVLGTPVLGVGGIPGALGGGILGFSAGLLTQTVIEAVGLGPPIEDLSHEILDITIEQFNDSMTREEEIVPCP